MVDVAVDVAGAQDGDDGAAWAGADRQFDAAVAEDPHVAGDLSGWEDHGAGWVGAGVEEFGECGEVVGGERGCFAAADAARDPGGFADLGVVGEPAEETGGVFEAGQLGQVHVSMMSSG